MASTDEDNEINDVRLVSAESRPNKKFRSAVWDHFTKVNISAECTRALCKQCKMSLVYRNGSKFAGTSHLKRHIETCIGCVEGRNNQNTPYTPECESGSASNNTSRKRQRGSVFRIPSGHHDSGILGRIDADSVLQPVPLSMRSPAPASNQPLAVTQGKITTNEPGSCEANAIFIEQPEHFPLSEPNSVSYLPGMDVGIGDLSSRFTVNTETIESLEDEVVRLFEEPMKAKCPTLLTSVDVNLIQGRVIGEFEIVDNFRIPEEVIKPNDDILLACAVSLLKIISEMERVLGEQLSLELVERWEGSIKDAETLGFNIKWLRERLNRVKKHWRSSFNIDKEVESHRQVLDAMQVKYDDLCTRKGALETTLSEVKIQIAKTEAKLSSEQEAIQEKLTQKRNFQKEPVSRW